MLCQRVAGGLVTTRPSISSVLAAPRGPGELKFFAFFVVGAWTGVWFILLYRLLKGKRNWPLVGEKRGQTWQIFASGGLFVRNSVTHRYHKLSRFL